MNQRSGLILLGQLIFYLSLLLYDDQIGKVVAVAVFVLALVVGTLSFVVEWIQPSKVSRWYFELVVISVLAPLLVLVFWALL